MQKRILFLSLLLIFASRFSFAATEADLQAYLLKGQYDRVIAAANGSSAKALYFAGLAYLKKEDFVRARLNFDQAINKTEDKKLAVEAKMGVADTYFLEQKFSDAAGMYENLLKEDSNNGLVALLLLRAAQSNIKQGKWKEGNNYLTRLKNEYPNSLEAQMAEPLSSTDEFFCVQVGSFSSEENAQGCVEELKSKGFDAYVSGVDVDNKTLYRVRVGECALRQEAEDIKDKLDQFGYATKVYP